MDYSDIPGPSSGIDLGRLGPPVAGIDFDDDESLSAQPNMSQVRILYG